MFSVRDTPDRFLSQILYSIHMATSDAIEMGGEGCEAAGHSGVRVQMRFSIDFVNYVKGSVIYSFYFLEINELSGIVGQRCRFKS